MDYNKLISEKETISLRINSILNNCSFELSIKFLVYIHDYLFKDILYNNGHIRKDNLEKPEEILNGNSIHYSDYSVIISLIRFAINKEKNINYKNISIDNLIINISNFISRIWLIHPFIEGNTRTVCVFLEEYLRSLGYNVNNDIFKENALYFRNALVRSNYENIELGIKKDNRALILFLNKVLIDHNISLDENLLKIPELFTDVKKKTKRK